jgi:cytoskeletal protein CcmA (bactofilin family)
MFGKEPENTTTTGAGGTTVSTGQTSIIAQGCSFEGTINVKGTLRIEGEFKGDITQPESLVVGKTGVVRGTVKVKNAIIGGHFYGNIEAENKIELQSGSELMGDIKTKRLVIDEGVVFEGNCSMGAKKPSPADAGPPAPPAPKATQEPVKK